MKQPEHMAAERIVVVMPNWLGDAVMATPLLRALRGAYPTAHIAALHVPLVGAVVSGLPWVDEAREYRKRAATEAVRWLREGRFDVGVLLPNSFRSAWMLWRGGVPRRVGYRREWRGWLLTDAVEPVRRSAAQRERDREKRVAIREAGGKAGAIGSAYEPVPTIEYYLTLGKQAGARSEDRRMELGVTEAERAEGTRALAEAGVGPEEPLVVMVPGAHFGASKCWAPQRFARVADLLLDRQGAAGDFHATVLLAGRAAERDAGRGAKVPLMIGANSADIGFGRAPSKDALFAQFGADADKAKAAYDPAGTAGLVQLNMAVAADQMMIEPARFVARTIAATGEPAFLYRFSYVAESLRKQLPGALHATEIPYVFDTVAARYGEKLTEADEAVARAANAYWVNFGKTGNPTGKGLPEWPAYSPVTDELMNFTNAGPVGEANPWKARLDLAEKLANEKK